MGYPESAVKLVFTVAQVQHRKGNEVFIAIVVGPMGSTSRNGQDIAPANTVHLLVLVCSS